MNLLVLAHTPPPLHGQSVMVQALIHGLPRHGISTLHVNMQLSHDAADIGRWRLGKIFATVRHALAARREARRHACESLYYVPAPPAKRGALYRDWVVMAICRGTFRNVILHWHATGLADWLETEGSARERRISQRLLGRAELAITLAESLRHDAEAFRAQRVAVVPNGIADSVTPSPARDQPTWNALFLGTCSEAKGLFRAAEAIVAANRRAATSAPVPWRLTAAGPFENVSTGNRFRTLALQHPGQLQHVGVVTGAVKQQIFADSHVMCFPTEYAAEGFPLVALEALAQDRPIVATRWRGLPDIVTPDVGRLVPPNDAAALVDALCELRAHPPARGACRARYERHFTLNRHLDAMAAALKSLP